MRISPEKIANKCAMIWGTMESSLLRVFTSFGRTLLLTFFASVAPQAALAQRTSTDETQIRALLAQYVTSIDDADVSLASQIWSHDPSVTFIHPLGTEHGFQQIAANVYIGMMGRMFSKRDLIMHDPVLHVYGDAAWSEMTWTFRALATNGASITTEGRETQVYHKERGAWHIVLVHYSGPPEKIPMPVTGF